MKVVFDAHADAGQIWALGTSTVGAGLETKPWAVNVPIKVQGVTIHPVRSMIELCVAAELTQDTQGDIIFSDPVEGCVVIPQDKVDAVLDTAPKLIKADDKVKEEVEKGMSVKDAFAKYRTNQ